MIDEAGDAEFSGTIVQAVRPNPETFNPNTAREPIRGITEAQFHLWAAMKADQIIESSRTEVVQFSGASLRHGESTSTFLGRTMHVVLYPSRTYSLPRLALEEQLLVSFSVSELSQLRRTEPDYRGEALVQFKAMLVDRINQAYAEFDPRSIRYIPPLYSVTADAFVELGNEPWNSRPRWNAATSGITTTTPTQTITAESIRQSVDLLQRQMTQTEPFWSNSRTPSTWGSTADGIHETAQAYDILGTRLTDGQMIGAARRTGKSRLMKEWFDKHNKPKPAEPTGPQQLDLFD
jgi:hypothetical protein